MITGVYQIRNLKNGKLYIGSAAQVGGFHGRWKDHRSQLKRNCHHSIKLQRAWNKYGEASFIFEILEECEPELCIEREQYYLDTLLFASCDDSRFNRLGYNICRVAGSSLGIKYTEEARAKMSKANSGANHPMYGKRHSEKAKQKMSEAKSGTNHPMYGKRSHNAKLTEEQVIQIKKMLLDNIVQRRIAEKFNVHHGTISDIKTNRTWRRC